MHIATLSVYIDMTLIMTERITTIIIIAIVSLLFYLLLLLVIMVSLPGSIVCKIRIVICRFHLLENVYIKSSYYLF